MANKSGLVNGSDLRTAHSYFLWFSFSSSEPLFFSFSSLLVFSFLVLFFETRFLFVAEALQFLSFHTFPAVIPTSPCPIHPEGPKILHLTKILGVVAHASIRDWTLQQSALQPLKEPQLLARVTWKATSGLSQALWLLEESTSLVV